MSSVGGIVGTPVPIIPRLSRKRPFRRPAAEVARLASKLDKLAEAQATQLEAVRTELQERIKSVRWVLGGLAVALTLIFAAGQFGFAYRQATGTPQAEQSPAEGTSPSGPP